jgi:hypothetical protein
MTLLSVSLSSDIDPLLIDPSWYLQHIFTSLGLIHSFTHIFSQPSSDIYLFISLQKKEALQLQEAYTM